MHVSECVFSGLCILEEARSLYSVHLSLSICTSASMQLAAAACVCVDACVWTVMCIYKCVRVHIWSWHKAGFMAGPKLASADLGSAHQPRKTHYIIQNSVFLISRFFPMFFISFLSFLSIFSFFSVIIKLLFYLIICYTKAVPDI